MCVGVYSAFTHLPGHLLPLLDMVLASERSILSLNDRHSEMTLISPICSLFSSSNDSFEIT